MSVPSDKDQEELFASLLADIEKRLTDGSTSEDVAHETDGAPVELENRLKKARQCLHMLERVRRAHPKALETQETCGGQAAETVSDLPAIGRFQIIRELGRGGHGVVYLARDPELAREVALKVPRPEILVSGELDRFLREAKAVASLSHANIVPVYETGRTGPVLYIACAYCRGPSLANWLHECDEPTSPKQAAQWTATMAEAIQHAHGRGVVHRDLKPSNILLEPQSAAGKGGARALSNPMITDFGLAKLLESDIKNTNTGLVLGTASYMAPEQATGSNDVGPPADLYALGAILYEMLVGRPPFAEETIGATLRAVEFDEVVRPSKTRPDLPRDLEAICLKCLEKDPRARYASGTALAADLGRYLRGEPVAARPVSSAERLLRSARRNPVVTGLIGAVMAALTLGAAIAGYYAVAQRRALAASQAALEDKSAALEETRRKIDHYVETVQSEQLLKDARFQPLRKKLLADALEYYRQFIIAHRGDANTQELAAALFRVSNITHESGDRADALAGFQEAAGIYSALREKTADDANIQRKLAKCYEWIGSIHLENGNTSDAESVLRQAIEIQQRLVEKNPKAAMVWNDLASTRKSLGQLYRDTSQPDKALEEFQHCAGIQGRLVDENPDEHVFQRELAVTYGTIGTLHQGNGRFDDALKAFQQAAKHFERLVSKHPESAQYQDDLAGSFNNMGAAYVRLGRIPEAQEVFQKGLSVLKRLAAAHPTVTKYQNSLAIGHMSLGNLAGQTGRKDDALNAFRSARPLIKRLYQDDADKLNLKMLFAVVHQNYASALSDTGDPLQSLPEVDVAIQALEEILQTVPNHGRARFFLGLAHATRGRSLDMLGRHAESLHSWRRACEFSGPRSGTVARAGLGRSLARNGQHTQALAEANRLVESGQGRSAVLYDAAEITALVAECVDQDSNLPGSERAAQFKTHQQQAIELLKRAQAGGYFKDVQTIEKARKNPDFARLMEEDAFREYMQSLTPTANASRAVGGK